MTCPASIDSSVVVAYCTRVDGHPGPHVTSLGPDYLSLGIALEVWDGTGRLIPHDPEYRQAVKAHREEGTHLEVIR